MCGRIKRHLHANRCKHMQTTTHRHDQHISIRVIFVIIITKLVAPFFSCWSFWYQEDDFFKKSCFGKFVLLVSERPAIKKNIFVRLGRSWDSPSETRRSWTFAPSGFVFAGNQMFGLFDSKNQTFVVFKKWEKSTVIRFWTLTLKTPVATRAAWSPPIHVDNTLDKTVVQPLQAAPSMFVIMIGSDYPKIPLNTYKIKT